jgi:hypothetical protein
MKKHCYNNVTEFYNSINFNTDNKYFLSVLNSKANFIGIENKDIEKYKYSYPLGVQLLNNIKFDLPEQKRRIKYYNQIDGYDINVERLFDERDYLLNKKNIYDSKIVNIYVNLSVPYTLSYENMLNKTKTVISICDYLEQQGISTNVFSCAYLLAHDNKKTEIIYEIKIKDSNEPINIGLLATSISPWFLRYWVFLHLTSYYNIIKSSIGEVKFFNRDDFNGILIDSMDCTSKLKSEQFINNLKL